jgi:hypothetical protein
MKPEGEAMQRDVAEKILSEERRKDIFAALVEAQDQKMTVDESHKEVAKRFGLRLSQVRKIEQEGLDNDWPPL